MSDPQAALDSTVQCSKCGRIQEVGFTVCLRLGWPKCHGYTMTLAKTSADVGAATSAALARLLARPEDDHE